MPVTVFIVDFLCLYNLYHFIITLEIFNLLHCIVLLIFLDFIWVLVYHFHQFYVSFASYISVALSGFIVGARST